MTCPFTGSAPLAHQLDASWPPAIQQRYRAVEEPDVVRQVMLRPEEFPPDNALTYAAPLTSATMRTLAAVRFALPPVLASASGPEHMRVRRIVARFFSPAKVNAQREQMRVLTREAAERAAGALDEGVDLAQAIAAPVPPAIMENLTGVETPPLEQLKPWSQDSLELFWGWPDATRQEVLARSAADYYAWLTDAVARAVAAEGGNRDGNLFAALHDGGVDQRRIRSLGYFLTIAGQETTAMLIQTVLATALERGQWADAATSSQACEAIVRDVIATCSSVPTWRRRVANDVTVAGKEFAAGEELVLRLSGEALAGDPRLAFGWGVHRCLGAQLATVEAEIVLQETARALPGVELAEPTQWQHLLSFQCVRSVPVRRG